MISNSERPEQEIADPQEIRQSLVNLDRSTSWFRWNTIGVLALLLAAFVALSLSQLLGYSVTVFVQVLFGLILFSNAYALYQPPPVQAPATFDSRNRCKSPSPSACEPTNFTVWPSSIPLPACTTAGTEKNVCGKRSRERRGMNHDLAVIVLDLDYFKEINDQFGHAAGDIVLKEFANRLRRSIRACDVPVRIGGDEFLVVLPECPRENVHIILSRLEPFEVILNRQKVLVSYSRGRAQYQVADTPQTLVQRADQVLYAEKAARPAAAARSAGDRSALPV